MVVRFSVIFAAVCCVGLMGAGVALGEEGLKGSQRLGEARGWAVAQVLESIRSDSPYLRANAIETAQRLPRRVVPLVQLGLDDSAPVVRFAALATIGKLRLHNLAPAAERLVADPSESVRAASLAALHQCGRVVDLSPLAGMLASSDPGTRGNVAMLLGQMGDTDSVAMLKEMARVPMPRVGAVQAALVRLQVAEALVKLGDESSLNAIRAAVYSPFDEARVVAVSMLGALADRRMEKAIVQLLSKPPIELQLAAAETLARLGKADGRAFVLEACGSEIATVRAQAALALAQFEATKVLEKLVVLLRDPDEQVRLSAAAAIMRIDSD